MNDPPDKKDYYQILGVLRTAGSREIAAAYRVLAWQHHPDVGTTDPESLEILKQVNEAYGVLSDRAKRREYDRRCRPAEPQANVSAAKPPSPVTWATRQPFPSTSPPPHASGDDIELQLPITPEEALYGGPCNFAVIIPCPCGSCAGSGQWGGNACSICRGEGRVLKKRRLRVLLPQNVRTGTMLRLPSHLKGALSLSGDLLLRLHIQPNI